MLFVLTALTDHAHFSEIGDLTMLTQLIFQHITWRAYLIKSLYAPCSLYSTQENALLSRRLYMHPCNAKGVQKLWVSQVFESGRI